MQKRLALFVGVISCSVLLSSPTVLADDSTFEVTITNVTSGQTFTPILVASHKRGVRLFELGDMASDELATLAEGGDVAPLAALLAADPKVIDTADSGGLLGPGDSVTVVVDAHGASRVSVAAMLIPTNDAFFALNGVKAPKHSKTVVSPAYDAGSEDNDEDCGNIPGPVCMGMGGSPGVGGEDYVHIHAGIHGIGDLAADDFDWRNPVAQITIRRVGEDRDEDSESDGDSDSHKSAPVTQ